MCLKLFCFHHLERKGVLGFRACETLMCIMYYNNKTFMYPVENGAVSHTEHHVNSYVHFVLSRLSRRKEIFDGNSIGRFKKF